MSSYSSQYSTEIHVQDILEGSTAKQGRALQANLPYQGLLPVAFSEQTSTSQLPGPFVHHQAYSSRASGFSYQPHPSQTLTQGDPHIGIDGSIYNPLVANPPSAISPVRNEANVSDPPNAMDTLGPLQNVFARAWEATLTRMDQEMSETHAQYERVLAERQASFDVRMREAAAIIARLHDEANRERLHLVTLYRQSELDNAKLREDIANTQQEITKYMEAYRHLASIHETSCQENSLGKSNTARLQDEQTKATQNLRRVVDENKRLKVENQKLSMLNQDQSSEISKLIDEWSIARSLRMKLHEVSRKQVQELKILKDKLVAVISSPPRSKQQLISSSKTKTGFNDLLQTERETRGVTGASSDLVGMSSMYTLSSF